jgi:hypothetical protein
VVAWIDRLLHRRQINPEEYEQRRCDLSEGTGIWIGLRPHGLSGPKPVDNYIGGHCPRCRGKGWITVRREEP